jgi:hypothetical protein
VPALNLVQVARQYVPFIGRDRDLTVFNAGSVGARRLHLPIVFGTLELRAGAVSLAHIDCETGQPWSPP